MKRSHFVVLALLALCMLNGCAGTKGGGSDSPCLGAELVIASLPTNASVFLDGAHVGVTVIAPFRVKAGKEGWVQAALEDGRQLRLNRVPYGVHRLKFRAIPDFGSEQEFEVEIQVGDPRIVVYVEILGTPRSPYVLVSAGTARIVGGAKSSPFDELDDF